MTTAKIASAQRFASLQIGIFADVEYVRMTLGDRFNGALPIFVKTIAHGHWRIQREELKALQPQICLISMIIHINALAIRYS